MTSLKLGDYIRLKDGAIEPVRFIDKLLPDVYYVNFRRYDSFGRCSSQFELLDGRKDIVEFLCPFLFV